MGLRPKTSAREPESGRMAVLERAYAEPTHTKLAPPSSSVIVGSAVPTAVRSRALRNKVTTRARNVSQNALPLLGFVPTGAGTFRRGPIDSADDMVDGTGTQVVVLNAVEHMSKSRRRFQAMVCLAHLSEQETHDVNHAHQSKVKFYVLDSASSLRLLAGSDKPLIPKNTRAETPY